MQEIKIGQLVDINRLYPNLSDLLLVINWETKDRRPKDFIIDTALFIMDDEDKIEDKSKIIYIDNKEIRDDREPVIQFLQKEDMLRDNEDRIIGKEQFNIILDSLIDITKKVKIGAGIYKAEENGYDLGMLKYIALDMYDATTGEKLFTMNLSKFFSNETCVLLGDIYHHLNHLWKFESIGAGFKGSISSLYTVFAKKENIEFLD